MQNVSIQLYSCGDFFAFGGCCSWRTGYLELEMGEGRNKWLTLLVDNNYIWKELQRQDCQSKIAMNNDKGSKDMAVSF